MNWIFCITGRSGERGAGARPDQSVISQTRAWQVHIIDKAANHFAALYLNFLQPLTSSHQSPHVFFATPQQSSLPFLETSSSNTSHSQNPSRVQYPQMRCGPTCDTGAKQIIGNLPENLIYIHL